MMFVIILQGEPDLVEIPVTLGVPSGLTTFQAQLNEPGGNEEDARDAGESECPPPIPE